MKLQELLQGKVNLEKTKIIRHNLTHPKIKANYSGSFRDIRLLEFYQAIQSPTRFKNVETVISFLGEKGTNGVLLGCYQVGGSVPFREVVQPAGFYIREVDDNCMFYDLSKTDVLADLTGRLVIEWGKGTINWCQNGTTEKEILEIRPYVARLAFESYEKTVLSFDELREIVLNNTAHKEWEDNLSAVDGVYLITDTKTGRHYVGSASGKDGIWGRWSAYVHTKHGDNKRLIELIDADSDYCRNFQFSILEVFPIKRDKQEVLDCEKLYKRKLLSIQHGLNDN